VARHDIRIAVSALSQSDTHIVEEAAGLLRSASDLVGLPDRAFAALFLLVDADLLTYNDVNVETGEARFVLRPRHVSRPEPFLRRFGYHPAATSLPKGPDRLDAVPRFVSDPKLRALGVGNCCGEAEIKLNAELPLVSGVSRLVGIGVSLAVREFTERERALLHAIQPHLVAAFDAALSAAAPAFEPIALAARHPRLTRRENEVLYWVAMGKTNEEIGAIIGARPLTVKKHLEHVYEKLEVPNRTAAAVAARSGAFQLLLPPDAERAA
jgi:DNA-binding CsgD family transcriptional regulator